MMREIRGFAVLEGARGAPPCDVEALAETLARVSRFAAANVAAIGSIDINPFLVFPKGQGGAALDAVILPA